MKNKNNKENGLKMLLSAIAVFGGVALFSGDASAFIPEEMRKGDDAMIEAPPPPGFEGIGEDVAREMARGAKFDVHCRIKCADGVPPKKEIFEEGDFGDALTPPALNQASFGVPVPRRVEVLATPRGDVSFGDRPEDRSRTERSEVVIPGIHDVTFAVSDGEKVLTGEEALDMAVGKERFFEAGKFKEMTGPDGKTVFELCF